MTSTSKAKTEHIEEALKPCPLCAGEGIEHGIVKLSGGSSWRAVTCRQCQARTGLYKTAAEAISAWNLRTDQRKDREAGEAVAFRWRMNGSQHWSSAHDIVLLPSVPPDSREYQFLYAPPPPASPAVTMGVISLRDPLVILAGIKQFGLASDGSDLRDLEATLTSPPGETAQVEALKAHLDLSVRMEAFDGASPSEDVGCFAGDGSWCSLGTVGELRKALSAKESPEQLRERLTLDTAEQVFFYEQDFYVLSNFSSFNLIWNGMEFPTSEHAYHWCKFSDPPLPADGDQLRDWRSLMDAIRFAPSAHEAFKVAERHKDKRRSDWDAVKVDIMRNLLRAKVEQHEYVRRKLLATGDRELVENSWRDDFWGWGENRNGQNMLGKLWMEIRSELRALPLSTGGGQ